MFGMGSRHGKSMSTLTGRNIEPVLTHNLANCLLEPKCKMDRSGFIKSLWLHVDYTTRTIAQASRKAVHHRLQLGPRNDLPCLNVTEHLRNGQHVYNSHPRKTIAL